MACIRSVPAAWARIHLAEINPYSTASTAAAKQSQSAKFVLIPSSSQTPTARPAPRRYLEIGNAPQARMQCAETRRKSMFFIYFSAIAAAQSALF
jgi:hypothetical protein